MQSQGAITEMQSRDETTECNHRTKTAHQTIALQSFQLNLEQLPLQVVPGLGAAGAGGRAGLPKPTTTGAYFLEPGGPQFRPPVPSRAAPGALDGGGVGGPGGWQMGIWSPPLGRAPQGLWK